MRPRKAEKLPIDSDLSDCALKEARDILHKKLSDQGAEVYWDELRVPSQLVSQALLLTLGKQSIGVELNLQYDIDEWSVCSSGICKEKNKILKIEMWSSGA